jgi:hypothetical protein
MSRTSAIEGFTVTFEHSASAPSPEPLWLIGGSVVPRVIWRGKPLPDWSQRFSVWVSGIPDTLLTPTLPGELLLHFGYLGALLAMAGLGVLWRTLYVLLLGSRQAPRTSGFLYIYLLALSLQTFEAGFTIEYGALARFMMVGCVMWLAATRRRPRVVQTA